MQLVWALVSVKSSRSDVKVQLELRTTDIVFDLLIPHSEPTLSAKIIKSKDLDSMPIQKNWNVLGRNRKGIIVKDMIWGGQMANDISKSLSTLDLRKSHTAASRIKT